MPVKTDSLRLGSRWLATRFPTAAAELTRGHIWTGRSLWADVDPFDDELEHELKPLIPAPLED